MLEVSLADVSSHCRISAILEEPIVDALLVPFPIPKTFFSKSIPCQSYPLESFSPGAKDPWLFLYISSDPLGTFSTPGNINSLAG